MQRRKMYTSLGSAMHGSSALFDTFLITKLNEKDTYVRFDLADEKLFDVPNKYIQDFGNLPLNASNAKIDWNLTNITSKEVSKCLSRYDGAYVKDPVPGIYGGTNSFVCDFDASRLYPSMMLQYNIGINTFYGRIISPNIYNIINNFLRVYLNRLKKISVDQLKMVVFNTVINFVKKDKIDKDNGILEENREGRSLKFANANEAIQKYFYIMMYLIQQCYNTGMKLEEFFHPQNLQQYIYSRVYFNNLIELFEMTNPKEREYNQAAYDYIINNSNNYDLYIIENFNNPTYQIVKVDKNCLSDYLKNKKIGMTMSGTLFKVHDLELSIFYNFLNELYTLRKQYKKQMFEAKDPNVAVEFNRKQITTKVIMNSTYGLMGMSSFRFSNIWLAKSITSSGRLALKEAQYFADKYIEFLVNNNQ